MGSSKSDYFVENDNAFSKLMGMMGDFENDDVGDGFMNMNGPLMEQQDDNSLMKTWEDINNFDFKKTATEKWSKMTSFVMGHHDEEDDGDYSFDQDSSEQNGKHRPSLSTKLKRSWKGSVSSLSSWWSSPKK